MLDLALLDVEVFRVAVIGAETAQAISQLSDLLPSVVSCDRVHLSLFLDLLNGEVRSEGHRETSPCHWHRLVPSPLREDLLNGAGPSLLGARGRLTPPQACSLLETPGLVPDPPLRAFGLRLAYGIAPWQAVILCQTPPSDPSK